MTAWITPDALILGSVLLGMAAWLHVVWRYTRHGQTRAPIRWYTSSPLPNEEYDLGVLNECYTGERPNPLADASRSGSL